MAGDHLALPDAFLGKPYERDELIQAIGQVLANKGIALLLARVPDFPSAIGWSIDRSLGVVMKPHQLFNESDFLCRTSEQHHARHEFSGFCLS